MGCPHSSPKATKEFSDIGPIDQNRPVSSSAPRALPPPDPVITRPESISEPQAGYGSPRPGKGTAATNAPQPRQPDSPKKAPPPPASAGTAQQSRLAAQMAAATAATPAHEAFIDLDKSVVRRTKQRLLKFRQDCNVRDVYSLSKTIGTGGFSIVKLATERATQKQWACKIMALPPIGVEVGENENTREDIFKEIDLLCTMAHENVIYLNEFFEENNKVYLITELLTGGELLDAVLKRGSYSEGEARSCFRQLLCGIAYLHGRNVIHRDLKLENLLLAKPDDISKIKIADFGLAKKTIGGGLQTICGTPQYVAPEVIMGISNYVYGPGVDMWSAGVVLYVLLGGYPPFWSDSEPQLFDLIRRGAFTFDDPVWKTISEGAKDLIRKLLVVDPSKRLTAKAALRHAWMTTTQMSSEPLMFTKSNMKSNMKRHMRPKFRAIVNLVIVANRLNGIIASRQRDKASTATLGSSGGSGGSGARASHADREHYRRMTDALDEKQRTVVGGGGLLGDKILEEDPRFALDDDDDEAGGPTTNSPIIGASDVDGEVHHPAVSSLDPQQQQQQQQPRGPIPLHVVVSADGSDGHQRLGTESGGTTPTIVVRASGVASGDAKDSPSGGTRRDSPSGGTRRDQAGPSGTKRSASRDAGGSSGVGGTDGSVGRRSGPEPASLFALEAVPGS